MPIIILAGKINQPMSQTFRESVNTSKHEENVVKKQNTDSSHATLSGSFQSHSAPPRFCFARFDQVTYSALLLTIC
jgi:hypothetical protein